MSTFVVQTRTSWPWLAVLAMPTMALAEGAAVRPADYLEEIIVTAQKWEQSANTVGMSITAVTNEVLQLRGQSTIASDFYIYRV